MLATVMLAGCATDYNYRGGNGDYYYGQPRVEYRYQGSGGYYDGSYGGYYGGFGLGYGSGGYGYGSGGYGYGSGGYGYGASYYYDAFGRLVYGYPGRYGYGNDRYRPRPHRGHDGGSRDHDDDRDDDNRHDDGHDQRPPWRNLGELQRRDGENVSRDDDDRRPRVRRQQPMSNSMPPARAQQRSAPVAQPMIRERSEPSSSPIGGFTRSGGRVRNKSSSGADE